MQINKRYNFGYIVDEAKLRRIMSVLTQEFTKLNSKIHFSFETEHSSSTAIRITSLEELVSLDNSFKSPIKTLRIVCKEEQEETKRESKCEIFFDDPSIYVSVDLSISSPNTEWAQNVNSLMDEQIERTLQRGFVPRLTSSLGRRMFPLVAMIVIGFAMAMVSLSNVTDVTALRAMMWLTEADIKEFSQMATIDTDALIKRQLRNISHLPESGQISKWFKDWRFYASTSPLLIVSGCLAYLFYFCYPPTVFNWGDMGERYSALVNRRKLLWSTVVFGTLIGLITNIAVYGFVDMSGRP